MSGSRPLKQGRSSTRLSGTTVETALPGLGIMRMMTTMMKDVGGGAGDDGVVEEQDDDNDDGGDDNYNDDEDLTSLGKNTPTVAVVTLKFFKVANMIAMKTHLRVPC